MSEPLAGQPPARRRTTEERFVLIGIILSIAASATFASQDAITKHLVQSYPAPFFLMVRYWVFTAFATAVALRASGGSLTAAASTRSPVLQIMRGLVLVAAVIFFALGLRSLKLVEMHAVFGIGPLLVTALSLPLLGERVGWRRWGAVGVGFIGLLVILRPGFGVFQTAAVFPILAALSTSFYVVLTRRVSRHDDFATTYLYTALVGAVAMTLAGAVQWASPSPVDWLWIGVLCVTSVSGHFLLIKSLEFAPASVLQPFSYLLLVFAATLGFIVYGELPDAWTLVGAGIVIASGLFVIWREHAASRGPS